MTLNKIVYTTLGVIVATYLVFTACVATGLIKL